MNMLRKIQFKILSLWSDWKFLKFTKFGDHDEDSLIRKKDKDVLGFDVLVADVKALEMINAPRALD